MIRKYLFSSDFKMIPAQHSDVELLPTTKENLDSFDVAKVFEDLKSEEDKLVVIETSPDAQNALSYDGVIIGLKLYFQFIQNGIHNFKIVLAGFEDKASFFEYCEYSNFLKCPGVEYWNLHETYMDIETRLSPIKLVNHQHALTRLKQIRIAHPSHYDSHHAITNEWCVFRWNNMFGWKSENIKGNLNQSLYFQYLDTLHHKREKFKKKKTKPTKIDGLKNKKIVFIDDEYNKGWYQLFQRLFEENSEATFLPFRDFSKSRTKQELISAIKNFVDREEENTDCFILDLRLHDDDFTEKNHSNLTGHIIAKYIKCEKNEGHQIMMFTASNKVWNQTEALLKTSISAYALKESPELNLNREESYGLYCDFIDSLRECIRRSYLKEIVKKVNELSQRLDNLQANNLKAIQDLLLTNDSVTLNGVLLTLIIIIENHCKENFELFRSKAETTLRKKSNGICSVESDIQIITKSDVNGDHTIFGFKIESPQNGVTGVEFFDDHKKEKDIQPLSVPRESDITLITSVLKYHYDLPEYLCQKVVELKHKRNTKIAHRGGTLKISLENDVLVLFREVVCRILTPSDKS